MKLSFLIILMTSFLIASQPATKEDLQTLTRYMDTRFDSMLREMDKRFV